MATVGSSKRHLNITSDSSAAATTMTLGGNGVATEAYVGTQITNLIDSSPAALNTLNELAAALGDDASFSTTVTNSIATKLALAGGTMTGNVIFNDSKELRLGTSSDFKGFHNGTNTHLSNYTGQFVIENYSDDKDILFASDDGSGGVTTYMYLDGSITETRFTKPSRHDDSVIAKFGDGNDLNIFHNGSNSYIETTSSSTGDFFITARGTNHDLYLEAADNIYIRPQGNENGIVVEGNAGVTLYYNNGAKLDTTSTGVEISGGLSVSNDTILGNGLADTTVVHGHLGIGEDNYPKIAYPGKNAQWSGTGSTTGQVVIDLPGTLGNFDMMYMEIDIYNYSAEAATKLIIGGHNWNSGGDSNTSSTMWHNVNVQVLGALDKPIYFGRRNDGTSERRCIAIGETDSTWSYATVHVSKVSGASSFYSNNIDWVGDWNTAQTTSDTYFTKNPTTNFNSGTTLETNGNISASNFSGSSSGTNTGDQDLSGLISSITVGDGLDGTTSSGDATISLDLSELTDMTADITTTVDELILLDNGAERRKRFSEIFGSAAYSNTSAFAAAAHNHSGTYALEYELMQSDSSDRDMHVWRKNHAMLSDDSGVSTYIIVQTNVPQDNYSMGGFTLVYQDAYNSSGEGGEIKIYGYWNPESNSGFEGFRYECSNPYHTPTIEVCRNSSSGKTAFFISGESGSYTQLLAKDLWLGYSAASATSQWGDSWTVTQASAKDGYTNFDTLNRNDFAAITTNGSTPSLTGGVSAAEVRTLIGAGTGNGSSNLAIGTTATTAMAGNTSLLQIGTTATTAMAGNTAFASTSHNHDGRYLRTHARYQNDLDTIDSSGVYIWDVSEADDEPTGASDGLLTIKYWDSDSWATASFQDFHNRTLHIKSKKSGTWQTDWAQVWTTDQLTTTNKTNYDTAYTHSQAAHAPSNAEQNVQSDWNATSGDSFIQNKPTTFAPSSHNHNNLYYTEDEIRLALARINGWEAGYGSGTASNIKWNLSEEALELKHDTDTSIGAVYKAVYMEAGETKRFSVMIRGSSPSDNGMYLRLYQHDGDLPNGKTHVSNDAQGTFVQ